MSKPSLMDLANGAAEVPVQSPKKPSNRLMEIATGAVSPDSVPDSTSPASSRAREIEGLQSAFKAQFKGGKSERWSPKGGRNIQGTNVPSLHNTGDALDLYHGNLQSVADWAIKQPGVKTVIYNRQIWSPSRGWRPYKKDPHTTHVHVDFGRGGQNQQKSEAPAKTPNKYYGSQDMEPRRPHYGSQDMGREVEPKGIMDAIGEARKNILAPTAGFIPGMSVARDVGASLPLPSNLGPSIIAGMVGGNAVSPVMPALPRIGENLGIAAQYFPEQQFDGDAYLQQYAKSKNPVAKAAASKAAQQDLYSREDAMAALSGVNQWIAERVFQNFAMGGNILSKLTPEQKQKEWETFSRTHFKPVTDIAAGAINPLSFVEFGGALAHDPATAWEDIKKSYAKAWDPNAPAGERVASGAQWAITVLTLGRTAAKGAIKVTNAKITKTLIQEGFTPAQAKMIVEAADKVAKSKSVEILTNPNGSITVDATPGGILQTAMAEIRQALSPKAQRQKAQGMSDMMRGAQDWADAPPPPKPLEMGAAPPPTSPAAAPKKPRGGKPKAPVVPKGEEPLAATEVPTVVPPKTPLVQPSPGRPAATLLEEFRQESADVEADVWDAIAKAIDDSKLPAKAKADLFNQIVASDLGDIEAAKRVLDIAEKSPGFKFSTLDRREQGGSFGLRQKGDREYRVSPVQTAIDDAVDAKRGNPAKISKLKDDLRRYEEGLVSVRSGGQSKTGFNETSLVNMIEATKEKIAELEGTAPAKKPAIEAPKADVDANKAEQVGQLLGVKPGDVFENPTGFSWKIERVTPEGIVTTDRTGQEFTVPASMFLNKLANGELVPRTEFSPSGATSKEPLRSPTKNKAESLEADIRARGVNSPAAGHMSFVKRDKDGYLLKREADGLELHFPTETVQSWMKDVPQTGPSTKLAQSQTMADEFNELLRTWDPVNDQIEKPTAEEFAKNKGLSKEDAKSFAKFVDGNSKALRSGQDVPKDVLSEYPELSRGESSKTSQPNVPAKTPPQQTAPKAPAKKQEPQLPQFSDKERQFNKILPNDSDDPNSVQISHRDYGKVRLAAKPFEHKGIKFFVHPEFVSYDPYKSKSGQGWVATEPRTGFQIASHPSSSKGAADAAKAIIDRIGVEAFEKKTLQTLEEQSKKLEVPTKQQKPKDNLRKERPDADATRETESAPPARTESKDLPQRGEADSVPRPGEERETGKPPTQRSGPSDKPDAPSDAEGSELGRGVRDGDGDTVSAERGAPAEPGRSDEVAAKPTKNYRYPEPETIGKGTFAQKTTDLLAALKALKEVEKKGKATPAQLAAIAKFPGWGWTGNHLNPDNPPNPNWLKSVRELLTDEEFAAARRSTLNSHYTSPEVIQAMWKGLKRLGYTGGKALEPSAGTGLFIGLEPKGNNTQWAASELDDLTGRILKVLNPAADVRRTGYEKAGFEDESFDLAISNVPFGNYPIYDPDLVKKTGEPHLNKRIHNYFFAKALEQVRPGGVVAFITTHGTLDAGDAIGQSTRRYLASQADLLGAIRLPDTAFQGNAGTEVVTDLIFLRKRMPGEAAGGHAFEGLANIKTSESANFLINEYFAQHPEMVLGDHSAGGTMYRSGAYTVRAERGADIGKLLNDAINKLPKDVMGKAIERAARPDSADGKIDAPPHTRVGGFFESDGKIYVKEDDFKGIPLELPKTAVAAISDYLPLRDASVNLIELQRSSGDADLAPLQKKLKQLYDAYVKRHGPINGRFAKYFLQDPESAAALMLEVVETKDGKLQVTGLADIFTKRVISPTAPISNAGSAQDAMLASMRNIGRIDMDEMERLSGLSREQIAKDLRGLIFDDPVTGEWLPSDAYGSGNVRKKLDLARKAAEKDPKFKEHVSFLEARQPKDLEAHEISAKLGAPWIPAHIYADFLKEILAAHVNVTYNAAISKYTVDGIAHNANNLSVWGIRQMPALVIADHILNSRSVTVTYKEDGKTYLDQEATQQAQAKADDIRRKWQEWIYADQSRADNLTKIYNQEVNAFVPRQFDGSFLEFPGQSTDVNLRAHQRNAVWRGLQDPATLLAHDVGTGKTFTIITTAMELRRTGLRKKPMIVVFNNTEGQFAGSFKRLYPGARLLIVDKNQMDPANRKKLFGRIAGNDWDAIIIRHSDFKKLPVSPALLEQYINDQIDALIAAKMEASDDRITVKDLEKSIANLETKLKNIRDKIGQRQDNTLYWEQLGVDHLFVDEAHYYKNLDVASAKRELKTEGSQMARDLMMKMIHLRKSDGGVTFATGTPVSNSLAELHTFFRYLISDTLKAMGLENFDPWMRMFTEETTEFVQDVAGRWKPVTKISKFSNIPELQMLFRQVADVVPKEVVENVNLPKFVDESGNVINGPIRIESTPNTTQIEYFNKLLERADKVQQKLVEPRVDNVLKISTDGRKASMDIRLIDPKAPDSPNSKINQAVAKVLEIYKRPDVQKHKGTQFIFLDYGTPKETKPVPRDIKLEGHPDMESAQAAGQALEARNYEYQIVAGEKGYDIQVDLSPSFNLYDDIKGKLIKGGIPANEIAYVHDAKTDLAKVELFDKVNRGDVRVLLGSTSKGGVGVNVQERLKAMHDLDAPWRPADYEQRGGRIERQGNIWADLGGIMRFNYINVGTYDAFMWNKLAFKDRFIKQVMRGEATVREAEDLSDDGRNSFAEMAAAATGDPRVSDYLSLQEKIKRMEVEKSGYDRQQIALRTEIRDLEQKTIPKLEEDLAAAERMNKAREAAKPEEFALKVGKKEFTDKKEAGLAILNAMKKAAEAGTESPIAHYSGFDLSLVTWNWVGEPNFGLHAEMRNPSFHTDAPLPFTEQLKRDDLEPVANSSIKRLTDWVESLGYLPAQLKTKLEGRRTQLDIAKAAFGKPWSGEERLADAKRRFQQLEEEIGPKLREGKIGGWGSQGINLDPEGVVKANSGLTPQDILDGLKALDDPSYDVRGSFKVTRKDARGNYGITQRFRQPLSIVDGEGKTLQVGTYERLAGQLGKKASETIRNAQIEIDLLTNEWERQLDKIGELMVGALDEINAAKGVSSSKRNRAKAVPDFVEIIEADLKDPRRTRAKGDLKKAIKLHDDLTEYMRQYIIASRRDMGIDTPDDWGITEQGYFRHLFLGDIRILVDDKFVGTARTYAEAQKLAMAEHAKNPSAKIEAVARVTGPMQDVLRVSTGRYFKVAKNIADSVHIPMTEIMEDMRGEIGLKSRRMKFFGALQKRTGAEGYSKDYMRVMRMHAAQVARTQELSKLNRALVPVIEGLRAKGYTGVAEAMEEHLNTIWGTATRNEKIIGDTIRNTPILRNYVANPDFALRGLAMRLTKLQSFLKLSWNPRSAFVNLLQPYSTLWPYISTKDFVDLYRDLLRKDTRKMLAEKGILDGDMKLEETLAGKKPTKTLFRAASGVNRAMGYLYGYRLAIAKGLPEEQAHKTGLAWAEKVEFDNSAWNGAPIFRNPEAKVLGQFKGFLFKNLEHWADAMRKRHGDTNFTRAGRISKLIGQQLTLGGLKSIIGIAKVAGFGYLGYKLVEHLSKLLQEMGMNKEDATLLGEAVYYGAPSLVGQDLSSSVTLVDAPFGNDASEQVVNFFFGPTTTMGLKVGEQAEAYLNAEDKRKKGGTSKEEKREKALMKAAKAITPYAKMGENAQKFMQSKDGTITIQTGGETMKLNNFESVMLLLGFSPLKQSRYYDRKEDKVKGLPIPKSLVDKAFSPGPKKPL